jgi:hypothetical protein
VIGSRILCKSRGSSFEEDAHETVIRSIDRRCEQLISAHLRNMLPVAGVGESGLAFVAVCPLSEREPMHKTPAQIARSLRAFRNAHRLGLWRCVRVVPGPDACEAARSQYGVEYLGNVVPHLPLAQCTRDHCECKYKPIGSEQFRRLYVGKPLSPN